MKFNNSGILKKMTSGGIIYIIFLLLIIFFWIMLGKTFVSVENILTILRQTAMISIMAIGMCFALSAGEIDLSVDSIIAFTAITVAMVIKATNSIILAFFTGLGVGIAIGFFNGTIVAWVRVPSFLVTLASMGIISGLSRWVTHNQSIQLHLRFRRYRIRSCTIRLDILYNSHWLSCSQQDCFWKEDTGLGW